LPGEALGAAGAGQDAEADLGEADLPRASAGDAEITGQRDLEAAADGVAVERRDAELRRVLQAAQSLVGVEAEVVFEARVGFAQRIDVGAGAEELLPV